MGVVSDEGVFGEMGLIGRGDEVSFLRYGEDWGNRVRIFGGS